MCHFRRLCNGMFDHHRVEITVMQFTSHSLPVHQSVTVLWDFNPVPYCQPSSPTPMEYALPPSLEWHVWWGRRSIYNTHRQITLIRWSSLTLSVKINPYRQPLPAGLQGYILCPHGAYVYKSLLFGQHWLVHVPKFLGERCFWVRPCFSSSVSLVLFILNGLWEGK